jgi:hypothetical protein
MGLPPFPDRSARPVAAGGMGKRRDRRWFESVLSRFARFGHYRVNTDFYSSFAIARTRSPDFTGSAKPGVQWVRTA